MNEPFFSSTCEPALSRRRLLMLGAAALATRSAPWVEASEGDGSTVIQEHAKTSRDPWVVAHAIRGMGRDFTIEGGRRAVDFLLEEQLTSVSVNGRTMLAFPRTVEIHPNMFLKTMLEAGVPLDYGFTHMGQRRTVADLVESARLLLRPGDPATPPSEQAWTIIALTRTVSTLRSRWTNAWGDSVDLHNVFTDALSVLERASLPVLKAMKEGRRLAGRAPVHHLTCGGTHLIYSVATAVHTGYASRSEAQRVSEQLDLLVWRLGADVDAIDRFHAQRTANPLHGVLRLGAKLKILGHAEECLAFTALQGVRTFSPDQQTKRQIAVAEIRRMIAEVEVLDLGAFRSRNFEAYQQMVGDVCHARHGLTMS